MKPIVAALLHMQQAAWWQRTTSARLPKKQGPEARLDATGMCIEWMDDWTANKSNRVCRPFNFLEDGLLDVQPASSIAGSNCNCLCFPFP